MKYEQSEPHRSFIHQTKKMSRVMSYQREREGEAGGRGTKEKKKIW